MRALVTPASPSTRICMLSTGLGGRGDRRDVSPSDAEYDPGRPLQDLIAGILESQSNSVPFDPLIIDSMAELNQVLSTQHTRAATCQSNSVPFDPLIIDSMADSELDQVLYSTPGPLLDSTAELDQVLSAQHARAATWLRLWELCTIQSVVYMHQEVVWVVKTEQDLKEGVRYKIQRCTQGDDAPQLIRNGYGLDRLSNMTPSLMSYYENREVYEWIQSVTGILDQG
ncbi:hypothetical protein BJV78DRAFT_1158911 [Lactifluus subvellereus]|nr:hypothetical protein BJV78DRAFT_1158911 [Lactifluus subvellereus]